MNWHEQYRKKASRHKQRQKTHAGATQVNAISGIPFEATPDERFRLTVEVERVCERETKAGDPCYFLSCRDTEGMTFSLVVFDSQWSNFQESVVVGSMQTLDVRVPKEGFSSFTLA